LEAGEVFTLKGENPVLVCSPKKASKNLIHIQELHPTDRLRITVHKNKQVVLFLSDVFLFGTCHYSFNNSRIF
jgi:hypothetical protein